MTKEQVRELFIRAIDTFPGNHGTDWVVHPSKHQDHTTKEDKLRYG